MWFDIKKNLGNAYAPSSLAFGVRTYRAYVQAHSLRAEFIAKSLAMES